MGAALLPLFAACGSGDHGTTVPIDSVINSPPPPAAAGHLVFGPLPKTIRVNDTLPAVQVEIKDANNAVLDVPDTIVLTIDNNPSQAHLGGQTLAAARHGIATFSAVHFDAAGSGYTLRASSAFGRVTGISDSITVTP